MKRINNIEEIYTLSEQIESVSVDPRIILYYLYINNMSSSQKKVDISSLRKKYVKMLENQYNEKMSQNTNEIIISKTEILSLKLI